MALRKKEPSNWSDRLKAHGAPGLSFAVIDRYRLVRTECHGLAHRRKGAPVTPRTLFRAASVSKTVNAAAVLRLVQDGVLDLDADVNRYLRSWKVPDSALARGRRVTLRRLLSHRAGFNVHGFDVPYRVGRRAPSLRQVLDGELPAVNDPIRVVREPGSRPAYSGGGIAVVQQLLEDVTGQPYPRFVRETIFSPLGMRHSSFAQPLPPRLAERAAAGYDGGRIANGPRYHAPVAAAGGLWTTPGDLAKFLLELQNAFAGRGGKVLRAESARLLLRRRHRAEEGGGYYGLGVELSGARGGPELFWHSGSHTGFQAVFCGCLHTGQGVVAMLNGSEGGLLWEVARAVAREYRWSEMP
jgi:CubicO group peptidase (beta-lactamase class C family)